MWKIKIINLKTLILASYWGSLLNFGKRYEDDIRVIFHQWQKLHLGLDALSNQKILNGIYSLSLKKVEKLQNFFWGQPSHFTQEQKNLWKQRRLLKLFCTKPKSQESWWKNARKTFPEVKTGNGYCVEKTRESTTDNLTVGLQFHFCK